MLKNNMRFARKPARLFFDNGADYVIDSMSELPDLITVIEKAG